jgi:hypothetical protein
MKKLFPGETGGINEINTNEEIESQKNWLIKIKKYMGNSLFYYYKIT